MVGVIGILDDFVGVMVGDFDFCGIEQWCVELWIGYQYVIVEWNEVGCVLDGLLVIVLVVQILVWSVV